MTLPAPEHVRHVIFDLDGTLIDHFETIYRCYVHAQERLGLPVATYARVRATVGGSVPVTMARLVGEERAPEAVRVFHECFEKIMLEGVHLMPGTRWLLEALHASGRRLAVFTNKEGEPSRRILADQGLDGYFAAILGTGDTAWRKPEPEFTAHLLQTLGATLAEAVLIGDSPFDIAAARAGGVPALLVATGSHGEAELAACEPTPHGVFSDFYALGEGYFGLQPPPPSERERLEDLPVPE